MRIVTTKREFPSTRSPLFSGRLCLLLLLCLALAAGARPATAASPVHTYDLLTGINATVNTDGSLEIMDGLGPLLSGRLELAPVSRRLRDRTRPPFARVVAEGAVGGQRGFSANRDDDGDGSVDEDPIDGRDNDGDGRIDEDFAAISDAMVVIDRAHSRRGASSAHLEYYHWSYPWLRSTVFLSIAGSASQTESYHLELPDDTWYQASLQVPRHSLAGKAERGQVEAYIAQPRNDAIGRLAGDCLSEAGVWVGVLVSRDRQDHQTAVSEGRLAIASGAEPTNLAVCVAESWLQLNYMLNEAALAQAGAEDKMTGRRAPMIVAPQCAGCRLAEAPEFTLERMGEDQFTLTARIEPGRGVALDPDLFRIADQRLGAPTAIQWLPTSGPAQNMPWACGEASRLSTSGEWWTGPYLQLSETINHRSDGQLRFVYEAAPELPAELVSGISGAYLDGRLFDAKLLVTAAAEPAGPQLPEDVAKPKKDQHRASLSPRLLEGFPNPFRDQIQLRFAVPATVGEAFVWGEDQEPPDDVNLQAAPPWQNGTPSVSVRIYSLNGQELVTLFSASVGPGENTVQWDGTDQFGRKAASGTYFCKFQVDKWSVTKRLVYLR